MARRSRDRVPTAEDYLPDEVEEEDDEVEEDRPRRKRRPRSRDDDEEDERPRRRRRPRDDDEDEDDDEEDEDDDEEEERRPRRASSKKSSKKRRRPRDDDDEDERPRKKKRRQANNQGGWGSYHKAKEKTSSYADKFKPNETETLVKFLEDAPLASINLHWFNEVKQGKKGWMCLESPDAGVDEDCPACDAGDRPSPKAYFNVVVFDEDGDPELKVLEAGTRLAGQLEQVHTGKSGPLSKHYWALTASGTGGQYSANTSVVKERDLVDDWDVEPLDDDDIDEFLDDAATLQDIEQIPDPKEFRRFMKELDD